MEESKKEITEEAKEAVTAGPRTSNAEFLTLRLNKDVAEMKRAAELADEGDVMGAEHVFAEYVRHTLRPERLLRDWYASGDNGDSMKSRVEDILDYKFISCGIPHHFEDHKVDWLSNPTYNNYCEWPWQLSRHNELDILARYYALSGDDRAVKAWAEMIESWFSQAVVPEDGTPGNATICWRTIEAGIRMQGWSRQIHAFISSPYLSDKFITRYFASIYEHGHRLHIAHMTGNWLIMEMHGLLRISVLYPFIEETKSWNGYALNKLEEELSAQLYPDDFQYELTTNYHSVVDYSYYQILKIYLDMELPVPAFLTEKLERLYNMYPHLVRPDGCLPDLNDGAQLSIGDKMKLAHSLYPEREDFRFFATEGREGAAPGYLSYAFPYSGAVVMRTDWGRDAVWAYMDCSPFGKAHQHEDKLNVLVSAYGKVMINEAGVYDYDTSEMRQYVLDTRSHNTIRINGNGQNQRSVYVWNPDDINKKADLEFSTSEEKDFASSSYTVGYGPELDKTVHERKLIFFKNVEGALPFFAVIDRLTAPDENERSYESQWHLENCDLKLNGNSFVGDFDGGVGISAAFSDTGARLTDMCGQYEPYYQGWFPIRPSGPHEHRRVPTPVLCGSFTGSHRIVTILYPYKDGMNALEGVKASDSVGDMDFTVILKDGREINLSE